MSYWSHPSTVQGRGSLSPQGSWVEVGRTTLGSPATNIDVTSLPYYPYYMVLSHGYGFSASKLLMWQVGNAGIDTDSNYNWRYEENGGSDVTGSGAGRARIETEGSSLANDVFGVSVWLNIANRVKLMYHNESQRGTAGDNIPHHREAAGKWENTSDVIDSIRWDCQGAQTFGTGSEVVVLGWEPGLKPVNAFWQPLGAVSDLTSTGVTLASLATKKYIFGIAHNDHATGPTVEGHAIQLGNGGLDTGNNYTHARSVNGAADTTAITKSQFNWGGNSNNSEAHFFYIINVSAREKLIIFKFLTWDDNPANAPSQSWGGGKWVNTSAQIDTIGFNRWAGTGDGNISLKLWGHD